MEILFNLGLTEENIREMLEISPFIKNLPEEDIAINIEILNQIGCKRRHIKNIIIANPNYLLEDKDEILEIITILNNLHFTHLYLLLDTNPFLLTTSKKDIESFIKTQKQNGLTDNNIKDLIENDPYIIS